MNTTTYEISAMQQLRVTASQNHQISIYFHQNISKISFSCRNIIIIIDFNFFIIEFIFLSINVMGLILLADMMTW
jgi:hypothetical protein